jgi:zinc protease
VGGRSLFGYTREKTPDPYVQGEPFNRTWYREPPLQIDYTKVTLDNGLDVIVHEDHDLPIVAVNLWYHVGSKNERPGLTGFAHLFEHLMFEGSQHHDKGFFPPLQEAGASLNGSTNADRTNYWEVVPTNALELALWLESDRMGYLLPALTEEKFATQREVVLNERRQNYENRPYGMAGMAITGAIYPPDHPYHWPTIGFPPDLRAASLADVRAFFERFYHPANASLALAGDIDSAHALDLVRAYFADLPAGPAVPPVEPPIDGRVRGELRLVLEDRVELPRLYLAWPSPALFADADAAFDVVADLLANGKTSRLYRLLVHERRLALDVSAAQQSRELDGLFQIAATAAPGHGLDEIDRVITETLAGVAADGATDAEMARGLAQAEAHFIYRLQTVGGFSGKSDQLNAYNVFVSNPGYFSQDLDRYRTLAEPELRAAARTLTPDRRVALSIVPLGQTRLALAGSSQAVVS